jgi:MFS family permease
MAMCVFALGAAEHLLGAFIAGNVLSGLALGVAQPELTARLISSVSAEDYGSAAGLQAMFTQIAAVLGIAVLGGMAAGRETSGHAPYYVLAYLIGGIVAIVAIFLAVWLNTRIPDSRSQPRQQLAKQESLGKSQGRGRPTSSPQQQYHLTCDTIEGPEGGAIR